MRSDQLVNKVLDAPDGGVEELLHLCGHDENDWLEFKASIYPLGDNKCDPSNRGDLAWNIARAAVALANTIGGALLIGVDDDGEPIGLSASDPDDIFGREGAESFLRKIIEPLLRPAQGWNTKKHGRLRLSKDLPGSYVEFKVRPYQSVNVAIIVIRPLDPSDALIGAVSAEQRKQFFPVRVLGDIGRVRDLYIFDEVQRFRREDLLATDKFERLLNQFTESHEGHIQPALLPLDSEDQIRNYYELVAFTFRSISQIFTELSSAEHLRRAETEFPEPIASEDRVPYELWDVDALLDQYGYPDARQDTHIEHAATIARNSTYGARSGPVLELMHQVPQSLWLGAPGSGKSTCLIRHCLQIASTYQPGGVVAVYAPLRAYGRSGDLWGLLTEVTRFDSTHLESLADLGRLWVHLDGLNECPSIMQLSCKNEIRGFLTRFPKCGFLVTTRLGRIGPELGLPTFSILPLDRDQQQRFLAAYFTEDVSALATLEKLWRQPGGDSIASNPFILRLLADIALRDDEGTAWSRAQIYRRYVSAWHRREAAKSARNREFIVPSLPNACQALGALAFRSRHSGMVSVSYDFAVTSLRECLPSHAEEFVHWAGQGLVLTIDPISRIVAFGHETIQEYFCAEYIVRNPGALALLRENDAPAWSVSIALALELGGMNDEQFVREAIRITPIICALFLPKPLAPGYALRKVGGDDWTRGVVGCLLGAESVNKRAIVDRLTFELPSRELLSVFRSDVFWYAVGASPYGMQRMQQLVTLMCIDHEPWADLIPACQEGNPQLAEQYDFDALPEILFACGVGGSAWESCIDRLKKDVGLLARATIRAYDNSCAQINVLRALLCELASRSPDLVSPRQWDQLICRGFLGFPARNRWISDSVRDYLLRKPILWPRVKQYRPELIALEQRQCALELLATEMPLWRLSLAARVGLLHRREMTGEEQRRLLQRMEASDPELVPIDELGALISRGILSMEEIPSGFIRSLIAKQGDSAIVPAVQAGLLSESDVDQPSMVRALMAHSPQVVLALKQSGRLSAIPAECKEHWLRTLPGAQIFQLVDKQILVASDVSDELRVYWLNERSIEEHVKLYRTGLLRIEDIIGRVHLEELNTSTLAELVSVGRVECTQLSDAVVERAIEAEHTGLLLALVEKGRVSADTIASKCKVRFSNETSFRIAMRLVKSGLIQPNEFSAKCKQFWINSLAVKNLGRLVRGGMLDINDIPEPKRTEVSMAPAAGLGPQAVSGSQMQIADWRPIGSEACNQMSLGQITALVANGSLPISIFRSKSVAEKCENEPVAVAALVDNLARKGRWVDAGFALLIALYGYPECLRYSPLALNARRFIADVIGKVDEKFDFHVWGIDDASAQEIGERLIGRAFLLKIAYVAPDSRGTGWLDCDALPERIYCNFRSVPNLLYDGPRIGQPIYGSVKLTHAREQRNYLLKTDIAVGLPY